MAVHRAVRAIRRGECGSAIAGGANVIATDWGHQAFSKAGMLSPDGKCRSLSRDANGYVRGEGAVVFVLKPLHAAVEDGDHIYAIVRGSAENHGGRANSLTAPTVRGQVDVINAALDDAGVSATSLSYVELHATGTPLGDPIEIRALKTVMGSDSVGKAAGPPEGKCGIGSIKSNLGHLEIASGAAGIAKILLQIKHRKLAASLHCEVENPLLELAGSGLRIVKELEDWPRRGGPRRAGVSSFGFGGVNAHVVLEEHVEFAQSLGGDVALSEGQPALLILSARTPEALQQRAGDLLTHLQQHASQDRELIDIAYTLQLGREAMEYRLGFGAASLQEARDKLAAYLQEGGVAADPQVYTGSVNLDKEVLSVLLSDEGIRLAVEQLAPRGRGLQLLKLWVRGMSVEWGRLYEACQRRPCKVALPTYPFSKERYWPEIKPSADASTAVLHPLVHRNTSDLSHQKFSSVFSGEEFYLSDHLIGGVKVFPGACYVEMAREAVRRSLAQPDGRMVFCDIRWMRKLSIEGSQEVHIAISAAQDGRMEFEVYTEALSEGKSGAGPTVHARGVVQISDQHPAEDAIDVVALRARAQRIIDSTQCYEGFASRGVAYGPAHRCIEKLSVGSDELGDYVIADLSLPACVRDTAHRFVLHPSLLDGALQASIGFEDPIIAQRDGGQGLLLPYGVERLEIFERMGDSAVVILRQRSRQAGSDQRKVDIQVCDPKGVPYLKIHGFQLVASSLPRTATAQIQEPLLERCRKIQDRRGQCRQPILHRSNLRRSSRNPLQSRRHGVSAIYHSESAQYGSRNHRLRC